jgi:zinc protease
MILRPRLVDACAFLIVALTVGLATHSLQAAGTEKFQLKNGLTVILRPVLGAKQIALVILFKFGGNSDPAGQSGRAHLLEHMYITARAGKTPAQSVRQIMRRYPLGFNAQTGSDYTVIATVFAADKLKDELAEAAARMSDLKIEDLDIKRETPRLLTEVNNMYGGIPGIATLNHIRQNLSPIAGGGRHGGTADHVKTITAQMLQQIWKDYYKPKHAILVLAGDFDTGKAKELVNKSFAGIDRGKELPKGAEIAEPRVGQTFKIKVRPIVAKAGNRVAIGYAPPKPKDPLYPAYIVFGARLMTQSSRNFKPGSGQMPPVYFRMMDDATTFGMQATVPAASDHKAALAKLAASFNQSLGAKIQPFEKIQASHLVSMMLADYPPNVPDAMLARNIYGVAFGTARRTQLGIDAKALRAAIAKVTEDDLQRLGKKFFAQKNRVTVMIEVE